jgi:hypothetical protein
VQTLGVISRLPLQRASLKAGRAPRRWYDPAPLLAVPAPCLGEGGVSTSIAHGERILDVHHQDHRASKNVRGRNGISIGFTAHDAAMRARFGEHLEDGLAGENILVQTDRLVHEADVRDGVAIVLQDGRVVRLARILLAEPCVEFTRYALRYPHDAPSDRAVTEALSFLSGGMRGYYASYTADPVVVRLGDRVVRG